MNVLSRPFLAPVAVSVACLVSAFNAHAQDYFSLLDVRYEAGMKKSFLGGPYRGKSHCDKVNQNTWDHIQPVCGNCTKETQACAPWADLTGPLLAVMQNQPTTIIYIDAMPKSRIILSGANRTTLLQECETSAKLFREAGYSTARCVK